MREIKFRAKARFSGTIGSDKWLYSSLMRLDAPTHRLNLAGQDCDIETLGQFTGLLDKNGKEIYEGDIVVTDYGTGPVEYSGVGFSVDCDSISEYWETSQSIEVIGNIHENPELLEERE